MEIEKKCGRTRQIYGKFINIQVKFWSEIPEVFLPGTLSHNTIIYFLFSLEVVNYLQVTSNPQINYFVGNSW